MAGNERRERDKQRRLARQRGAGTREIKNADFGFTIGAAPLEAKSSKTPQALPARPSSRKTPAQDTAGNTTTTRTRRSASTPKTGTGKGKGKETAQKQDQTPTVTGKRKRGAGKTTQEQEEDELEADDEQHRHTAKRTFVTPATRQSPAAQSARTNPPRVPEGSDELEDADADHTIVSTGANARASSAALLSTTKSASKRAANDPPTTTPAAHASQPGLITTPFIDPLLLAARKSTAKGKSKVTSSASQIAADQENIGTTYTPGAIVSFKPRTPLVPVANMFPVSGGPSTLRPPTRIANDISPLFEPGEEADAEGSPAQNFSDDGSQGESSGEDELTPAPTTAPRKTKPQQKKTKSTPKKSTGARPAPKTKKSNPPTTRSPSPSHSALTVPIAVYRPTTTPTIYSTLAPDADPLGAEPTPSLNPVDVLAQITSEITRSFIASYDVSGSSNVWGKDGVRKRQRRAVARFGGVLADGLFALTGGVGAGEALRRRVGVVRRRVRGLREELGALRREREDVGREMEGVRRVYWAGKERVEGDGEIGELVGRIREDVRRMRERVGNGEVEMPLEGMVDDVADLVGGETGLMTQVKGLNERMEKMAEEIEKSG